MWLAKTLEDVEFFRWLYISSTLMCVCVGGGGGERKPHSVIHKEFKWTIKQLQTPTTSPCKQIYEYVQAG